MAEDRPSHPFENFCGILGKPLPKFPGRERKQASAEQIRAIQEYHPKMGKKAMEALSHDEAGFVLEVLKERREAGLADLRLCQILHHYGICKDFLRALAQQEAEILSRLVTKKELVSQLRTTSVSIFRLDQMMSRNEPMHMLAPWMKPEFEKLDTESQEYLLDVFDAMMTAMVKEYSVPTTPLHQSLSLEFDLKKGWDIDRLYDSLEIIRNCGYYRNEKPAATFAHRSWSPMTDCLSCCWSGTEKPRYKTKEPELDEQQSLFEL